MFASAFQLKGFRIYLLTSKIVARAYGIPWHIQHSRTCVSVSTTRIVYFYFADAYFTTVPCIIIIIVLLKIRFVVISLWYCAKRQQTIEKNNDWRVDLVLSFSLSVRRAFFLLEFELFFFFHLHLLPRHLLLHFADCVVSICAVILKWNLLFNENWFSVFHLANPSRMSVVWHMKYI